MLVSFPLSFNKKFIDHYIYIHYVHNSITINILVYVYSFCVLTLKSIFQVYYVHTCVLRDACVLINVRPAKGDPSQVLLYAHVKLFYADSQGPLHRLVHAPQYLAMVCLG